MPIVICRNGHFLFGRGSLFKRSIGRPATTIAESSEKCDFHSTLAVAPSSVGGSHPWALVKKRVLYRRRQLLYIVIRAKPESRPSQTINPQRRKDVVEHTRS